MAAVGAKRTYAEVVSIELGNTTQRLGRDG
jgi:hypothetical protein